MSKNSNILSAIDNHITLIIAVVIAICMTFCSTGCSGGDYERIPGPAIPAITDAGPDGTPVVLTPPGTTPDPNSGACKAVPAWWDLRSYQGCMAGSSRLAGAIRFSDRKEQSFKGKPFLDTEGDRKGQQGSLFYLTYPSAQDCGPVKVAMVSSSGSLTIQVASEVEFYTLRTASVEAVWTKLHGGSAPALEEYYSNEFSSLLIDLFECEREKSCSLTNRVAPDLLTGIVQDGGSATSAVTNGTFCERLFILMRSK